MRIRSLRPKPKIEYCGLKAPDFERNLESGAFTILCENCMNNSIYNALCRTAVSTVSNCDGTSTGKHKKRN